MGIPGEDLANSLPATAFVGWYNGRPDYSDLPIDLSCERALVVGNGNVAMDVTRLLVMSPGLFTHLVIMFFIFHIFSHLNPIMPPTSFTHFLPESSVIYTILIVLPATLPLVTASVALPHISETKAAFRREQSA